MSALLNGVRKDGRDHGGLVLLEVYGGQWQLKLFFLFAASFKRRVGGWNPIGKNWMAPNEKSAPDREFWGVGNRLSWSEAGLKPPKTNPTKPPRRTSPTENPPVRATSSPALQLIPWPHMSSPTWSSSSSGSCRARIVWANGGETFGRNVAVVRDRRLNLGPPRSHHGSGVHYLFGMRISWSSEIAAIRD